MIFNLFQKEALPSFVSEIIKSRLKREINRSRLILNDGQSASYIVSTSKGFLNVEVSQQNNQLEIEKAVFKLCQTKNIPVPKIIFYEKINDSKLPSFLMIKEMSGKPFAQKRVNIFDYNRVLGEFAELLLMLHKNRLSEFGFLNSNLKAQIKQWHIFLNKNLDEELKAIHNHHIFSPEIINKIEKHVFFKPGDRKTVLLHGHIASSSIYVDNDLKITELTNFKQPLAGDPHYEMAGFLLYEGFDRAKRLIKQYCHLGGLVQWDSPYFLQISLRRAIRSLYWAIIKRQSDSVIRRKEIITQLLTRL